MATITAPYCATAPTTVSLRARPASAFLLRPRASAGRSPAARAVKADYSAGGKWWAAPLLGWSGRADYLEVEPLVPARDDAVAGRRACARMTEEKAREMRARMAETECFHDAMYHSAIASRLARPS